MRTKYPALKPHKKAAPAQRVAEELRNVRIKDCWILVVKYEKSKVRNGKRTGDNDFHLVIGSAPSKTAGQRMDMEVAGLPKNGGPDASTLLTVRKTFLSMCPHTPPAGRFAPFSPPIHVSIEGSLSSSTASIPPIRLRLHIILRRLGRFIRSQRSPAFRLRDIFQAPCLHACLSEGENSDEVNDTALSRHEFLA